MVPNVRSEIGRQVSRVRRRLFFRELLGGAIVFTVAALAVTTVWLLAEPWVWRDSPSWLRWAVLSGTFGIGLFAALIRGIVRRPDATKSALWLDDAFGLRERVTTSLSLSGADAETSAGQALLSDALQRVKGLKVRDQFPVQIGSRGWLVPSAAGVLALVALFYDPALPTAQGTTEDKPLAAAEKVELDKKMQALSKAKREPLVNPERGKSEELKKLEAKLDEIAKHPRDTTQQLRERIKEMTPLEEQIKKLERERNEKSRMMQQQLQMKDQLMPNDNAKDGPAKDFQQALAEGDLDKARDEMDKLAKKLANNELTEQDKQKLAKQLNDLQKKLGDLSQQKNKEDLLKKLAEEGKLDPEALEREMAQLRKDNEKLKDLQKLADKLNQCQNCMKAGDAAGAKKALSEATDQMSDMAREKNELDDLRSALNDLQDAKDAMCKAGEGDKPDALNGDKGGGAGELNQGTLDQPGLGDFAQGGGRGSGKRPDGDQGKIRPFDAKQDGKMNAKGQKRFDGFVPGQAFKKKSGVDLASDIQQAAQDAPEAIETQRIPKAARDMAKGYFKNLGGQVEPEKKDEKKEEKK